MVRRNTAAIDRMLRSPSGTVGVDLKRRGVRVTNGAKAILTATQAVDTGRLRAAQEATEPVRSGRGLMLQVGSNVIYSLPVHEGGNSPYAPASWRAAASRGRGVPARRFLTRAIPLARA
jgi:hypothetical protein